jgi:cathepsin A (carboxypeptidase C)
MKELDPLSSLLSLSLLFLSPVPSLAVPPNVEAQAAFSQSPFSSVSSDKFQGMGIEWMDDAKKAILRGKENLERWYHKGTEYIKEDNLSNPLQTFLVLTFVER